MASTHGDHSVRVTDIKTGKCRHVLTGHPRTPWCVQFHPTSNDLLATGCLAGEVRIWDLRVSRPEYDICLVGGNAGYDTLTFSSTILEIQTSGPTN